MESQEKENSKKFLIEIAKSNTNPKKAYTEIEWERKGAKILKKKLVGHFKLWSTVSLDKIVELSKRSGLSFSNDEIKNIFSYWASLHQNYISTSFSRSLYIKEKKTSDGDFKYLLKTYLGYFD